MVQLLAEALGGVVSAQEAKAQVLLADPLLVVRAVLALRLAGAVRAPVC